MRLGDGCGSCEDSLTILGIHASFEEIVHKSAVGAGVLSLLCSCSSFEVEKKLTYSISHSLIKRVDLLMWPLLKIIDGM